jgi:signal transduction histidine kinase/DNA-binding NarL/FixJ family response regulator
MASILVIDDDPPARELLCTVLGYAGHRMREAADGAEGLAAIDGDPPQLVIVDLLMPTMDGLEFVRRLRELPAGRSTPVIFYTAGYLQSEANTLARSCGVAHLIVKPAEPEQIFKVVDTVLGEDHRDKLPLPAAEHNQQQHLTRLTAKLSLTAAHVVPRLEAMMELGLRLASEVDPQRLLEEFCSSARKIIGARYATVAARSRDDEGVQHQFSSGLPQELAEHVRSLLWRGPIQESVLNSGESMRLAGLAGDPQLVGLPREYPQVRTLLCVPLQSPQRVYGWLLLTEKIGVGQFSEEDEALAQTVAAQVGRIYENGALYRRIKQYAEQLEAQIAERKLAQEQVHSLNAELEKRIEARTADLMQANADLEAFAYSISHDLRAPLRAISGFANAVLESEEGQRLTATNRRHLRSSIEGVRKMAALIDRLLAFARHGRASLVIRRIDMSELVRGVCTELLEHDRGPPVELHVGTLPEASGDTELLREAWVNLVSNALKYSSKRALRRIAIDGCSQPGECVFSIKDNGVGFDMAHAQNLFGVFQRLHSGLEFEGSGAGLAIVERIVRRHGGNVWAEAALDAGATFYMSLPCSDATSHQ